MKNQGEKNLKNKQKNRKRNYRQTPNKIMKTQSEKTLKLDSVDFFAIYC